MAKLRLEHIYKVYPNGTKAVSDFTMDIDDKEFIVFVGPSGCGKSTTLRMIAGLEDISAGELYIGDKIVNDVEPKDRDIAMVFQNYALYPHMTVYENMAFGLKLRHVPNSVIHEKVIWAAKILDLTEYLDRKPKAMSGGQRQRVALGRAILRNPKVMLLDEPLSNLDAKLRAQMRSEIAKLHDELKTTFIYVTHDQVEAMTLGTRVVVMKAGRIMQVDTPKNLYDYPNNLFVAGFIGTPQMNFFKATLKREKNQVLMSFKYSDEQIVIPQSLLAKVQPHYFDGKTEVVVGARCEFISLDPEVVAKSQFKVNVRISHFEELGNETLIYADLNKNGDGFRESSTRVIIKGTSNYNLQKGQFAEAAIDVTRLHLFDSQTEKTINPRIPNENLVFVEVKNQKFILGKIKLDLPKAITLPDGNYDVVFPVSALSINKNEQGHLAVGSFESIEGKYLLGLNVNDQVLFAIDNEKWNIGDKLDISLDFTKLSFLKDGETIVKALSEYDKINAMFINHATAKGFVGDLYESEVENRIAVVRSKFEPQIANLQTKFEQDCQDATAKVNTSVLESNKNELAEAKEVYDNSRKKLKEELDKRLKRVTAEHEANNKKILAEVDEIYNKIKDDELNAFATFKRINKDKDAYRKRYQEIKAFKNNIALEKKNELNKRLNLELIRYDSDLNTEKGIYKRTLEGLKKNLVELEDKVKRDSNPVKFLEKDYKNNLQKLNDDYKEQLNLASLLFFMKTSNLITLATDEIAKKMIQGLGIKVFTKEYYLEIPHNAYYASENGLEVCVDGILDFGDKKYLKCLLDDEFGSHELYIMSDGFDLEAKKLKIAFDIKKVHITEKSMDIKIY